MLHRQHGARYLSYSHSLSLPLSLLCSNGRSRAQLELSSATFVWHSVRIILGGLRSHVFNSILLQTKNNLCLYCGVVWSAPSCSESARMAKAKGKSILVKLMSAAGTGFFYVSFSPSALYRPQLENITTSACAPFASRACFASRA